VQRNILWSLKFHENRSILLSRPGVWLAAGGLRSFENRYDMLIKYLRRRVLRDPQLRKIPVRPDTKTPDLSRRVGHFLPRFPGRVFGCDLLRVSPKQAPRTFSSSVSSNIRWAVSRSSIVRVKLRYFLALAKMLATRRFRFTAVPPQIRGPGIENGSTPLTTFAQYPSRNIRSAQQNTARRAFWTELLWCVECKEADS
jgi:hypothetical protein